MSYEMKKIKSFLFKFPIGWSFYPIVYRSKKYVVEIISSYSKVNNSFSHNGIKYKYFIYEYESQKKKFIGNKRKCVFIKQIHMIPIEYNYYLDTYTLTEETIKKYLPKIMKYFFKKYQDIEDKKESNKNKIIETDEWDGIVE